MTSATREPQTVLPEWRSSEGVHLCHVYTDDDERARVLSAFISSGLELGAKVLCLEDAAGCGLARQWLAQRGVALAGRENAFLTAGAEETYCPGGRLAPDALLQSFAGFCSQALREGYSGVRIAGDMGWAVRTRVARELLLEYETKATDYATRSRAVAVCEYDARKFDGRTIMDILSVHPAMLVGGQVVRNPHYLAPEELQARLSRASAG